MVNYYITWNGQLYALCSHSNVGPCVIRVEIVVKDGTVVIQLIAVGEACHLNSYRCPKQLFFLTGTCTELFLIVVGFRTKTDRIPGDVSLFKLDMASINWKELECLKNWDMSGLESEEFYQVLDDYLHDLAIIEDLWEEVQGFNDTIIVVDLVRDNLEYYNPAIASELGGYIHILDKMDKVIYSYRLTNNTIVRSPMPSSVLPKSHMSMWACWLEDDRREAEFIVDSKLEEDEMVINLISDNEVEVGESRLLDIPFDVLEMMMKFCVGVEYINFRATCKRCHLAARLIQWRNHTSLMRLQDYSLVSPWLMVVDRTQGIITFTDPILGDNYFMRCSQLTIANGTICCSRFGWLLFKTSEYCPVFFNPFTNDLRELPEAPFIIYSLWFSAPPASPECMVVGFTWLRVLILYVARETTWLEFDLCINPREYPICFPKFHGEGLYALHKTGELMVFRDLGKDNVSIEVFKAQAPRSCSCSEAQYFLVTCDQRLLLVVMGGLGESIEVFKLNESTQEWEKVNGVGKHMIYICDTTCLCIEVKMPEMENKIFLAQPSSRNKKIVFFHSKHARFTHLMVQASKKN
uniref:uncharacterized protein LOC122606305 n=1 Tax=Erigeron canadensis TaxID=72917 RepID=UPI001CB9959C|nr:uncharacterized protein LOC122606305 [Erigeron canadensis]